MVKYMSDRKKIYFITLGCKVNSRESDGLRRLFLHRGFVEALCADESDVIYINSCTVTAEGASKSRAALRRARRTAPNAVIVFAGCLPQVEENLFAPDYKDADIIVGNTERAGAIELVENALTTRSAQIGGALNDKFTPDSIVNIAPHHDGERFEPLPFEGDGHTRAFLKIQDGCPRRCSYCIVSRARGMPRSADKDEIINGAKKLVEEGHREIVLCGINLSYFGSDKGTDLGELCFEMGKIDGLLRIRLGSLEPDMLSEELCENLSRCDKLAPHFHLSLQSGSDKVLRDMNRVYDRFEFLSIIKRIENRFDRPTFTTDIMVGFPGESEQDFDDTLNMVETVGFLKVHAFRYSRRPGTLAADLPEQLSKTLKKERASRLAEVAEIVRNKKIEQISDIPDSFIAEKILPNGRAQGVTGRYLRCSINADGVRQGDILTIVPREELVENNEGEE